MTLKEAALLVATILERSPRYDRNGWLMGPESIDEPEGRVRLMMSGSLADLLAHRLRKALSEENG